MNSLNYLLTPIVVLQVAPLTAIAIWGLAACGIIIVVRKNGFSKGKVATASLVGLIVDLMALLMFRKEALGHLRGLYEASTSLWAVVLALLFITAKVYFWQTNATWTKRSV